MSSLRRPGGINADAAHQRKRRRRFAPKPGNLENDNEKPPNFGALGEDRSYSEADANPPSVPSSAQSWKLGREISFNERSRQRSELKHVESGQTFLEGLLGQRCRSVDCYERLNFIDEGTYGRVFRARDVRTGEVYALKQVKIAGEREGFPVTALREVSLLLATKHPNIVHVKEVVVGSTLDRIYMVMEYAEHDMRSVIERMRHPYSQSEVKSLLHQLLEGVAHLHANWIVHRDLKTSNLLLTNRGVLKICDFGLARRYGDPSGPLTPHVTTLWYRAPEVLLGATEYAISVDLWAVGCIFAELVLREALFTGRGELDQLSAICRVLGPPSEAVWPGYTALPNARRLALQGPLKSELLSRVRALAHENRTPLTSMALDLLSRMLVLDPLRRITASEALQHPYFDEAPAAKEPQLIQTMPERHER
jgi:cell division cycle 2-like